MTKRFVLMVLIELIAFGWAGLHIGRDAPGLENNLLASNQVIEVMTSSESFQSVPGAPPADRREAVLDRYNGAQPRQWGEKVTGVAYALETHDKVVALTFDLCGGSARSNGYDQDLVDFLENRRVPATFFISGLWLEANPELFHRLAANALFEIGSHGARHLPLSTTGRQAYGIRGTDSLPAALEEVDRNSRNIEALTGKRPRLYRSGTNYYDEVAVAALGELDYKAVGYSLLGDAGATFERQQVKQTLLQAQPGSIVILHANHPESGTAEGVRDALPILLADGFVMVRLSDYSLQVY